MVDSPSPMPIDRDEPMDLEGLEGTTAALQSSRPATTVPPPSSSTTSVPAKKKVISIEEYNHNKATEWQLASAYLNRDEYGEDLDYEDFEPQDDPANIQIGYQTPTPLPQIADLPPLQDATSSASPSATMPVAPNVTIPMPQGSTGPGTVLGTTVHHVATAANWAQGFSRGLPVARALPMQVGTCWPQLHQCRWQHWQPCHMGPPVTHWLWRRNFCKGLHYHALPSKRPTYWPHR